MTAYSSAFANFSGRRLAALLRKEVKQITRDPATLLIAGVLPLLLIFLFGYAVSLDTSRMRIGIALEDHSANARGLAQAYQNSRWFDVRAVRSVAELRPLIVSGDIRAIIVIPADSARRPLQIITDGSLPQPATFVAAYAEGVRATWAAQSTPKGPGSVARAPAIELVPRFWFNPGLRSSYLLVPGSIAIIMTIVGTLLTALVVAREWERGTMEAILATPVSMLEFLVSKLLPYFVLALGSMAICTLLGVLAFQVPFRGSVVALLAIASAFMVPALGQGILISAATRNQFVASQIALLSAFLPAFLLSGFLFEISSMPKFIQAITYLVPARYLIPSLQTVFVAGDIWPLFAKSIVAMLVFGALFLALTLRVSRKRLD